MISFKKLIIDGNNLLHRAYWVSNRKNNENDLKYLYIFFNVLRSYIKAFLPSEIIVCWDLHKDGGDNFRKSILESYKGTRKKEFNPYKHIDHFINLLSALGVKQLFPKRGEADDIMWWLCSEKYPNECILISNDTDLLQLIREDLNGNIIFNPHKKTQINSVYLQSKYNVKDGNEYIIRKALKGDIADNIPGIFKISSVKIKNIINTLGKEFDFKKLEQSNLLNEEEMSIFKRNLDIMKLDKILSFKDEIEYYEDQLKQCVSVNSELFEKRCKEINFKVKTVEWINTFNRKRNEYCFNF